MDDTEMNRALYDLSGQGPHGLKAPEIVRGAARLLHQAQMAAIRNTAESIHGLGARDDRALAEATDAYFQSYVNGEALRSLSVKLQSGLTLSIEPART